MHSCDHLVQLVRRNDEEVLEIVRAVVSHPIDLSGELVDDQMLLLIGPQAEQDAVLGAEELTYALQWS